MRGPDAALSVLINLTLSAKSSLILGENKAPFFAERVTNDHFPYIYLNVWRFVIDAQNACVALDVEFKD